MEENGMRFDDKEIEGLAQALYEDAAGLAAGEEPENCPGITVDDLKAELAKHDGLLENLSIKYEFLKPLPEFIIINFLI